MAGIIAEVPDFEATQASGFERNTFSNREIPENISEWEEQIRDAVVWHLVVMEDVDTEDLHSGMRISGQFTPQNVQHTIGSRIADVSGFSRENPLIQWIGGTLEVFSFQARFWSEHSGSNTTRDKLETLKLLKKPHSPLNRPPLTRFFWGTVIPGGMPCLVESIGGIAYDEIRPDGSPRGATCNITLKRFTRFTIDRVTISPVERTPIHVVRSGDTYESIAQQRYGDPLLGVSLRQQNPRFPMEQWAPAGMTDLLPGETIKLYPKRDLQTIKPQSHIFNEDNQQSADLRRYYFMLRARKTGIVPKR